MERPSERKKVSNRRCAEVATLHRMGRHEEADRLRWLYWPERMRAEELERQRGEPGKNG